MFNAEELSLQVGKALDCRLKFSVAYDPVAVTELSEGEKARLETMAYERRRVEWLRGRAALKGLLRQLGLSEDTLLIEFPHSRISLTHSAGIAIAAGLDDAGSSEIVGGNRAVGLGIDFEKNRPIRPGTERFFLSVEERGRLAGEGGNGEKNLLRLWTVKEAFFKASPFNRTEDGRHLTCNVLTGPLQSKRGQGRSHSTAALEFEYFTLETEEGVITVALAFK